MRHLWTNLACAALLLLGTACDGSDDTRQPLDPTSLGTNGLKLAGIGDSIMQGFNAKPCSLGICFDQPEYSFAQGTSSEVDSLYLRFEEPGIEFESVSGSEMIAGGNNAKSQALRLCQQKTRPNRIVILLGANDICNAASVEALPTAEQFKAALDDALTVLTSASCALTAGTSIHVLSIPRIDVLYAAGLAKSDVACANIWNRFGICDLATRSPTSATLDAIRATVDDYNRAIFDTIATLQADGATDAALAFSTDYVDAQPNTSFGTYEFTPDDLSALDCFHPSIQGQRKLACLAWESWQGDGSRSDCLN